MGDKRQSRGMSRRKFITTGAAGVSTIALTPALLDVLLGATGCKTSTTRALTEAIIPEDVLKKAVGLLMARGADFGDVFVERAAVDSVMSDDRKINTTTTIEKGVGIRAVKDGRTFYAYTDSFEPDRIYETARYVADAASTGAGGEAPVVSLTPLTSPLSFPIKPLPSEVAVEQKIAMFQTLTERAWAVDPRIVQAILFQREIIRQVTIATSSGKIANQTLGLTEIISQSFAKDKEGALQAGWDMRGAYAGRDFFTGDNSFERVVDGAAAKALKLLEAVDSPRGVFPVVLGPGMNGVLFHESCGHGMEADLVYKGSNYKDQIGKQTAAKGVTLVDDGTIAAFPGSYRFDDEGTPSQRTVLVEDGIQRSYLCDNVWGRKLGMESTGNGRRQSFRHVPIPRMTTTYIAPGDASPEEIIAATTKGFYAKSLAGGQVEPASGNFVFGVAEGYLIEDGRITTPLRGATLVGNGIDILMKIDMIAGDFEVKTGICGKDGQGVPVGTGQATLRIAEMTVGGTG